MLPAHTGQRSAAIGAWDDKSDLDSQPTTPREAAVPPDCRIGRLETSCPGPISRTWGLTWPGFVWRRAGPCFFDAEFFSTDSFAVGSFVIKKIGHEPVHFMPHLAGGTICGPILCRFHEFGFPGRILYPYL